MKCVGSFHPRSPICAECPALADCLDFEMPLAYSAPDPRFDAPLKVIVPNCRSHRAHDYALRSRSYHFRGVVVA